MVIYKYIKSLFVENPEDEKFCNEHNVVYFKPSKGRVKWLETWLKTADFPKIECSPDVVCYWRSFGTWGMYHPEDYSISICPYHIEQAPGGLEEIIKHEIEHLQHPEADFMSHEEKENYINNGSRNS